MPDTRILGFLILSLLSFGSLAKDASVHETLFSQKIQALINADYQQFIADGTPEFKAALQQVQFKDVAWKFGKQLKQGYSANYEGSFKQQGYDVYLWTISYDNSAASNQYKMVLSNDKVAGFWIQ
ncbi:MAG: hypothetical protein R3208_15550 [Ketobacteraceae bacterium]|nr:hypothetical protein [Ketobacteraceae bacterium]